MVFREEKQLKYHNSKFQFKAPFLLQADVQSILKSVDEQCGGRMKQIGAKWKGELPYREKTNSHVPSECCVHNLPMEMFLIKWRCTTIKIEKFLEYIEECVKWSRAILCSSWWQGLMMYQREMAKQQKKRHISFKRFNELEKKSYEIFAMP